MLDLRTEITATGSNFKPSIDDLDEYIGYKLKLLRIKNNIPLNEIARILNVSFQQVQKYERGINKISISKLCILTQKLNVPMKYFIFHDSAPNAYYEDFDFFNDKVMFDTELSTLVRLFSKLQKPDIRKNILNLLKTLQ